MGFVSFPLLLRIFCTTLLAAVCYNITTLLFMTTTCMFMRSSMHAVSTLRGFCCFQKVKQMHQKKIAFFFGVKNKKIPENKFGQCMGGA
jgi:hypothetical protein